jgi:hypothetical protein
VDVKTGEIEISGTRISKSALALNDSIISLARILTKKDRAEAQKALSLSIPRSGTVALYLATLSPILTTPDSSAVLQNSAGNEQFTLTMKKGSTQYVSLGLGAKYFLSRMFFLDAVFVPVAAAESKLFQVSYTAPGTNMVVHEEFNRNPSVPLAKLGVGGMVPVSQKLSFILGGGVSGTTLNYSINNLSVTPNSSYVLVSAYSGNGDLFFYYCTAGAEWKYKERLRISLLGNVFFQDKGSLPSPTLHFDGRFSNEDSASKYYFSYFKPRLNPLSITLSVSWYL